MTAAVIAAVLLASVLATALIAIGWRHLQHIEGRAIEQLTQADAMRQVVRERDEARTQLAQRDAELANTAFRIDQLESEIDIARRLTADADKDALRSEPDPDRRIALANAILRRHAEEDAARASRAGGAPTVDVLGPRAAPAEPTPAWAGLPEE